MKNGAPQREFMPQLPGVLLLGRGFRMPETQQLALVMIRCAPFL